MTSKRDSEKNFPERVLIVIGLCLLAFLLLVLVYYSFDVILLIFAASLLAIFLRGLSDPLGRVVKVSETVRILVVIAVLIAVIGGGVALLAPSIAEQMAHMRDALPRSAAAAAEYISRFGWGKTILDQLPSFTDVTNSSRILMSVGGIFTSTVGAVGNFFITILLAIYFAISPT